MKKIIIISYFFPPCSLTASQRINGWAKYLNEFGYYPTVITRNWENNIASPEDVLKSAGDSIVHNKEETYEVYYLPYKASFRDRIFINNSNNTNEIMNPKIYSGGEEINRNEMIKIENKDEEINRTLETVKQIIQKGITHEI